MGIVDVKNIVILITIILIIIVFTYKIISVNVAAQK